jgi:hypothetical protein
MAHPGTGSGVSQHAPRPDGNYIGSNQFQERQQAQRHAEGMTNAHMHRNRRRGRDWPDLVGRCDVRVGPREQRRIEVGRNIATGHYRWTGQDCLH